jgi:hypothetical protein
MIAHHSAVSELPATCRWAGRERLVAAGIGGATETGAWQGGLGELNAITADSAEIPACQRTALGLYFGQAAE